MTNVVTYAIELIPENAAKIDAVNRIILGDAYTTVDTKVAATEIVKETASQTKTPVAKDKPATTLEQFKTAAKLAKKDHGEEFAMEALKSSGCKVATTLGRSMAGVNADDYDKVIALWVAGPQLTEQASDELEDDGFGDDEDDGLGDEPEVDAEAVKIALKAYAKEVGRDEAKEIMTANGAAALSKVDDCSPKQLAAMIKALAK